MSLDGHDKLCGYQNSTFPLCIHGGQDTYSARINFLRIWTTNSNPKIIGKFYMDYLCERRGIKPALECLKLNYIGSYACVLPLLWPVNYIFWPINMLYWLAALPTMTVNCIFCIKNEDAICLNATKLTT